MDTSGSRAPLERVSRSRLAGLPQHRHERNPPVAGGCGPPPLHLAVGRPARATERPARLRGSAALPRSRLRSATPPARRRGSSSEAPWPGGILQLQERDCDGTTSAPERAEQRLAPPSSAWQRRVEKKTPRQVCDVLRGLDAGSALTRPGSGVQSSPRLPPISREFRALHAGFHDGGYPFVYLLKRQEKASQWQRSGNGS